MSTATTSRRRHAAATAIGLAGCIVAACGGQLPTPQADLVADTTVGKNRCQVTDGGAPSKEMDRPFVVEWDATDIASFESKANRDLVFVKIDGCNLKVLDCRDDGIAGKYGTYDAPQWTTGVVEGFEIKNEGDLFAKLPFGATTLSGNLKGGNELQLKYFVSGSRPALRSMIYRGDLGQNPLCTSATHFVAGYDLGAFDLTSKGSLAGSATVAAPVASAGGNYAHSESHVRAAGSLGDCTKDSARELARCRVPIRLSLRAVADGTNPGGPPPASAGAKGGGLPYGMSEEALGLIQSAMRKMQLKDGAGCLADLNRLDSGGGTMPSQNMDMVRAECEMLVGRCDDGRRRYRAWLERSSPGLTPEQLDSSVQLNAVTYCQGKEKTPIERVEAAHRDLIDALYKSDRARCAEDGKVFLEQCPKIPATEKSACDGARYVADCMAKVDGGDCDLGRRAYELYVNRYLASNTPESRAATIASYKCPKNGPSPASDRPPPNKKKPGKKKN